MAFQFLCPQGHLLEGPESLAGQTCQCPHCASVFVVPALAQAVPAAPVAPAGYADENPGLFDHGPSDEEQFFDQISDPPAAAPAAEAPAAIEEKEDPHRICRLICPCQRALVLPTPKSMMGADALCPHCNLQFTLNYEDTLEYKEEKEHARELREQAAGKAWLKWAYIIASVVGICLVGMIVWDAMS